MEEQKVPWFDTFTRNMLIIMFVLLFLIYGSARYMNMHKMEGTGTDEVVNNMASEVARQQHHPLSDLPGDAQVGAFSVANFFAGLIVGHNWRKLFENKERKD